MDKRLPQEVERKGQPLPETRFTALFCIRITIRHKIVERHRTKSWDFSFTVQGTARAHKTIRGADQFFFLFFLWHTKNGTDLYHWEFTRHRGTFEDLRPRCVELGPEQASRRTIGLAFWGRDKLHGYFFLKVMWIFFTAVFSSLFFFFSLFFKAFSVIVMKAGEATRVHRRGWTDAWMEGGREGMMQEWQSPAAWMDIGDG